MNLHTGGPLNEEDMRPFSVWRCEDCQPADKTHTCRCTPRDRWLRPYICRSCFDRDLLMTASTEDRTDRKGFYRIAPAEDLVKAMQQIRTIVSPGSVL